MLPQCPGWQLVLLPYKPRKARGVWPLQTSLLRLTLNYPCDVSWCIPAEISSKGMVLPHLDDQSCLNPASVAVCYRGLGLAECLAELLSSQTGKATGGEKKIATVTASGLPPAFALLPHATHSFLYASILLASLSTQQIKHWLSPYCGQHTSASVFSWKLWRSWRVSATPLHSNRWEVHWCCKCIIAMPAHLIRPGLSDTFSQAC